MILDIPIHYHANVIAPRKRIGENHKLVGTARVELREATQADAPVVMWWPEHSMAERVAVRSFEGELYTPARWSRNHAAENDTTICGDEASGCRPVEGADENEWSLTGSISLMSSDGLAERLKAGTVQSILRGMTPSQAPSGKTIEEIPVREVVSDTLGKVQESYAKAVGLLLAVDGVVYEKVSIPILFIDERYRGDVAIRAGWSDDRRNSSARTFAVTEYDAALAAWRKARTAKGTYDFEYDEPGNDPEYTGRLPRPDIVRPDLLPALDSQAFAIAQTGRWALDRLEQPNNGNWSSHPYGTPSAATYDRPVMMAYAHLRSAVAEGVDARTMLDRLRDVRESTERHGTLHAIQDEIDLLLERVTDADADLDAFEGLDDVTDFPGAP